MKICETMDRKINVFTCCKKVASGYMGGILFMFIEQDSTGKFRHYQPSGIIRRHREDAFLDALGIFEWTNFQGSAYLARRGSK